MRKNKSWYTVAAVLFWVGVWQLAAALLGQELLLASPKMVLASLFKLMHSTIFWQSVGQSASRILVGFLLGSAAGILLGACAGAAAPLRVLLDAAMTVLRATPVASFIILALLWVPSRGLSVLIAFMMVLPVVYTNVLQGLDACDTKLAEVARVFAVSPAKKLRWITLPQLMPWIAGGCRTAVGLAWKSGVAAEVIGLPQGSIGERMYQTKLYLETGDLFAWTLVIILLCAICEKLIAAALTAVQRRLTA